MLATVLGWLGGPIVNKLLGGALDAYKAKLAAGNTTDRIAADLAAKELLLEQRAKELSAQVIIAEQGRWYTSLPRPLFAFAFIVYVWKIVVWDKVLGWGVTDDLSPETWNVFMVVLTAYFGGRSVEKVAKIFKRG